MVLDWSARIIESIRDRWFPADPPDLPPPGRCKLSSWMEETGRLRRINSEGRGMSASMQEYDMNGKHLFVGAAVATVLALAAPA